MNTSPTRGCAAAAGTVMRALAGPGERTYVSTVAGNMVVRQPDNVRWRRRAAGGWPDQAGLSAMLPPTIVHTRRAEELQLSTDVKPAGTADLILSSAIE